MRERVRTQSRMSRRIVREAEHERYHPELEDELSECMLELRHNEMLFDLETEPDLIEQRIYERQALLCRYRYLQQKARQLGLHAILSEHRAALG